MLLEKKLLHRGETLTVEQHTYAAGNTTYVKDIVLHPGAVVILPVTENNEILLLKQYRAAIGETIIELPAGTLHPGEDPLICARREIIEETGFEAGEWMAIGELYPAPGFCNELQYCFIARGLSKEFAPADIDEVIEVFPCSFEELKRLIAQNVIQDAKTLAVLFRAIAMGFIPSPFRD